MKKKIANKWIKALKSKKFKQGFGALTTITKGKPLEYCCLGVLCKILKIKSQRVPLSRYLMYGDEETSTVLPKEACNLAGTQGINGRGSYLTIKDLADMNDTGSPFDKIADIIEKRYPEL